MIAILIIVFCYQLIWIIFYLVCFIWRIFNNANKLRSPNQFKTLNNIIFATDYYYFFKLNLWINHKGSHRFFIVEYVAFLFYFFCHGLFCHFDLGDIGMNPKVKWFFAFFKDCLHYSWMRSQHNNTLRIQLIVAEYEICLWIYWFFHYVFNSNNIK